MHWGAKGCRCSWLASQSMGALGGKGGEGSVCAAACLGLRLITPVAEGEAQLAPQAQAEQGQELSGVMHAAAGHDR